VHPARHRSGEEGPLLAWRTAAGRRMRRDRESPDDGETAAPMRPILKRGGRFLSALILLVAAGVGGFVCWLALRDPLAALPRATGNPVATEFAAEPRDGRFLQHVVLDAPGVGPIGLAISLPNPLPKRPLPIVMVLGGLATGERNIRHIPGGGDNAIVGYDWPVPMLPHGWGFVRDAPDLYDRALRVPGQIAAALTGSLARVGPIPNGLAFSPSHWARWRCRRRSASPSCGAARSAGRCLPMAARQSVPCLPPTPT
jgi:hypothetical protein